MSCFSPRRLPIVLSCLFLISLTSTAFARVDIAEAPPAVPGCDLDRPDVAVVPCGVIVIDDGSGRPSVDIAELLATLGVTPGHSFHSVNAAAGVVRNRQALQELRGLAGVTVIPDRPVRILARGGKGGSGGKTGQVVPAGVSRIGAAPGQVSVTGAGIGVAVIDTGLDFAHADLVVAAQCFDAFGGDCQDDEGHGTHVGGIIAAQNNDQDVVGVAPGASLYAVKVLDHTGSGTDASVMAGLQWVIDNGATVPTPIRVINMSLGRPGSLNDNPAMRSLIQILKDTGVSVVVAAGNDASKEVSQMIPAGYPEVIAVASTAATGGSNKCRGYSGVIAADTASYFTTDGQLDVNGVGVSVSAPGETQEDISHGCFLSSQGILSLKLGGGTTSMSGTSMAAPHVTGVVALLLQVDGSVMAPADVVDYVRSTLRSTATRIGTAPLDSPATGYSFDGEREGVVSACGVTGDC